MTALRAVSVNAGSVIEYLIRNVADRGWPAFHASRMSAVLTPVGGPWERVDGPGDLCMTNGDVTVAFAGEMNGWQVVVHGADGEGEARRIVDAVAAQVQAEVGQPVEVVEL